MKKALVLAFLLLIPCAFSLSFSELMYDALGSDEDAEWFEIYNNDSQSLDMQGVKFFEDGVNHNIVAVQGDSVLQPFEYAVIAENAVAFLSQYNYSGTVFDSAFSLSNTGETLVLKNASIIFANLTYSYIIGGSDNGFSVGVYESDWRETIPTPGYPNKVSAICDWKVSFASNLIFNAATDVSWKLFVEKVKGDGTNISIIRSVEDIFGNPAREYDVLLHEIKNKETLSYDPNLKAGTYLLKAEIRPQCNDTDSSNNYVERLIAIKEEEKEASSSLKIKNVLDLGKDKTAEFGQVIRVSFDAYRGDTTSDDLSIYVEGKEKISKVLKFEVPLKYTDHSFTIPISLFTNCKKQFADGDYAVIVEGFGTKDSFDISVYNVTDDSCIVPKQETSTKKTAAISSLQKETSPEKTDDNRADAEPLQKNSLQSFTEERPYVVSTIVFESSQRKSEKLVPYGFGIIVSLAFLFVVFSKNPL